MARGLFKSRAHVPTNKLIAAHIDTNRLRRRLDQCDINTGTVMLDKSVRLTPPSTISLSREWP